MKKKADWFFYICYAVALVLVCLLWRSDAQNDGYSFATEGIYNLGYVAGIVLTIILVERYRRLQNRYAEEKAKHENAPGRNG